MGWWRAGRRRCGVGAWERQVRAGERRRGGVLSRGIRQQEIETWLKNNAPEAPWVALDDRADLFRYRCPHLVEVAPTSKGGRGLNPMALQALHQMLLARMPNEPEPKAKFRP